MYSRFLFLALSLATCLGGNAHASSKHPKGVYHTQENASTFTLEGTFTNVTNDSVRLYNFDGIDLHLVQSAAWKAVPNTQDTSKSVKTFRLELKHAKIPRRFYFIGTDRSNVRVMLLGDKDDKQLTIIGDAKQFRASLLNGSALNTHFESAMNKLQALNQRASVAVSAIQQSNGDAAKLQAAQQQLVEVDKAKLVFIDSLQKQDTYIARLTASRMYISYFYDKKGHDNEIEYFAEEYFSRMALHETETFDGAPLVTDAFKEYAQVLSSVGMPFMKAREYIDRMLRGISPTSRTYKAALGGVVQAMIDKEPNNFYYYADKFLTKYKKENPETAPGLEQRMASVKSQLLGVEAPDFKQAQPDGTDLALSNLRGKVVLIDFWASWCGPCRRAMPEVKALYGKYHARNFEILGVSLDNNKDAWLKAIADDQLPWRQISDLRFWQNAAAVTYGITSIPQTILIDATGKIVGRNLQGAALEQKLDELLK